MFCTNDSSHSLRVKIFRLRFDPVESSYSSVSIDVWGGRWLAQSIFYVLFCGLPIVLRLYGHFTMIYMIVVCSTIDIVSIPFLL